MGVSDCIVETTFATMNFNRYNYTPIYMDNEIFREQQHGCKTDKILVAFIINFMESSHANLLVFDKSIKKVFRIEPNYGFQEYNRLYNTAIENRLERFSEELGYIYSGYLPSSCQRMWHPGFCSFISVARYIHGLQLDAKMLQKIIVDFLKHEYNRICDKNLLAR
jgi:hypothetical protein